MKNYSTFNNLQILFTAIGNKFLEIIGLIDEWTDTSTVQSDGTVVFSGLDDSYGYDLYCQNKAIGYSSMTKTGSGNNITLTYTVTGASTGDVCKLRIFK